MRLNEYSCLVTGKSHATAWLHEPQGAVATEAAVAAAATGPRAEAGARTACEAAVESPE